MLRRLTTSINPLTSVAAAAVAATAAISSSDYAHNETVKPEGGPQPLKRKLRVAIVGSTDAVGVELVNALRRRQFPLSELKLYASRQVGATVDTGIKGIGEVTTMKYSVEAARRADVVFLATSTGFSEKNAPLLTENHKAPGLKDWFGYTTRGPVVIDNSKAFRYKPDVPLVVPEINGHVARAAIREGTSRIIANPNCTTAIAAMALWPLYQEFGLESVIMSTYQAASGAGTSGIDELKESSRAMLNGGEIPPTRQFPQSLAFNVIPQIDVFEENGYTKEEMKLVWETRKIFGLDVLGIDHEEESSLASSLSSSSLSSASPDDLRRRRTVSQRLPGEGIKISATAVRVATLRAHAAAITAQCQRPVTPTQARAVMERAPGVTLMDDTSGAAPSYPMPSNTSEQHDVGVGRIRQSLVFGDRGLDFFVCGDHLLRGSALNAVLIAEEVFRD